MAYLGRNPAVGTQRMLDSLESQFNGTLTTFDLRYGGVPTYPTLSESLIVSLGGVLQEPGAAYYVSSDKIVFSEAPATGTECWILLYSQYGASTSSTPSLALQATGEPMGFEDRTHSTVSFASNTRTFSIAPNTAAGHSSYAVWTKGTKRTISATLSVQIGTTTGLYYIYFDAFGALQSKTTYFTWDTETPVAYVYWNGSTTSAPFVADERHGIVLDWQTHEYLHRTRGAVIAEGFSISAYTTAGNGNVDAHAQFDLGNGTFFDEDLEVAITHSATPTIGTFTQVLTGAAELPVFYLSGSSGAWVRDTPTEYACKQSATTLQYNLLTGSTWSTTPATNNRYVVSWVVATNDITAPIIVILGQGQYTSIGSAEAVKFGNLTLTNFPIVEFRPLWKVIFRTSTGFTNTPNALIANVLDLRQLSETGEAGTVVSDHGLLSGLADDDHSQYIHESLDRAGITANISTTGAIGAASLSTGASGVGVNIDNAGLISGPATITLDPAAVGDDTGLVRIKGGLEVLGTTTTISSTTLTVVDKNIVIAQGGSTLSSIDTAGIDFGSTAVRLRYNYNSGTNSGLSIEGANVGIGATAPNSRLEISSSSGGGSSYSAIRLTSTGVGGASIDFGNSSTSDLGSVRLITEDAGSGVFDDGVLVFRTSADGTSNERMRITSRGNVGIGTTNPSEKLEVNGRTVLTTGTAPFYGLKVRDYSNTTGVYVGSVSGGSAWYIGDSYYYNSNLWRTDKTHASSINFINGSLEFYTNTGLTAGVDYTPSRKMILDSSGNLLIGTSSATGTSSQPLQVTGGAYVSGSLGVGVTNPGANANGTLQVNGTIGLAPNSQIRQWTNADSGTLQIFATQVVASPNNSGSSGYTDGATIAAVTNSDGSLLLDIGRGTTSSTRFRIGNTSASNCYMQLGSTLYADTGSGNLGVGVVSPLTKLDSRGTILVATNANGNNLLAFGNSTSFGPLSGAPDGSHGNAFILGNSSTASGAPSYLSFWTTSNGTVGERARIQSTGEVSIGTTTLTGTASQPLQVTGGAYVSGSLGVGVVNPGIYKLAIGGNATFNGSQSVSPAYIYANGGGDDSSLNIRAGSTAGVWSQIEVTGNWNGTASTGGKVAMFTGGAERARIRADGMFEVKGAGVAGTSPALSVSGSAPANSLVLDSGGRLLVGTSSATGSAILQVQTPATFSTTLDSGVRFTNASTKVYPTTSGFTVTPGIYQDIQIGTSQSIPSGSVSSVHGNYNRLIKNDGTNTDVRGMGVVADINIIEWTDTNLAQRYISSANSLLISGTSTSGNCLVTGSSTGINLTNPSSTSIVGLNITGTSSNINIGTYGSTSQTVTVTQATGLIGAFQCPHNQVGRNLTITTAYGVRAFLSFGGNFGGYDGSNCVTTITNLYQFEATGYLGALGTGSTTTITNLYGLFLGAPTTHAGTTITNNWGLYQNWSSAKNWFAGASNQFPNITTTASGANAFLDSADSNRLYRSTSSLTYKRDVEDLDSSVADQILNLRPVWYRSKCVADCEDWSWYGLIAEEVAEIDPRFVHYGYQEDAYEFVETTETVDLKPDDPRREDGIETEEVTKQTRQLKPDAEQVPNGVAYDRLVVPLLDIIKRQKSQLDSLEARLSALEGA